MWENGTVYLISSGSSARNSYYLDSSSSGGDVFLATQDGLVPGDTDDAYDVYDARIPQPGDALPAQPSLCQGSACQGPPSAPVPTAAPASATFSGLGNLTAVAESPKQTITPKKSKKKVKRKRRGGKVKRSGSKRKGKR
jgi:hypothetical protein